LFIRSTSTFVCISGLNANGPPQLLEDINNLAISEGTPVGKVLFTVNATDPEGSPVHYGIVGTDRLGADKDKGEVRVVQPLDREVSPFSFHYSGDRIIGCWWELNEYCLFLMFVPYRFSFFPL
jgi:hypothetical protein